MIKVYADVFKGLGKVDGKYHINLPQNAKPVIHRTRKAPLIILPKLKETLNKLIKANVISKMRDQKIGSVPLLLSKRKIKHYLFLDPKELNQIHITIL